MTERIITKHAGEKDTHTLRVYQSHGGYEALKKVLQDWSPEDVIAEVKKSNLRGRGGAGFPAGVKWGFVPKETDKPKYLCINGDEGEPGTFKDRWIMLHEPHMMIEGAIITCYAIGIHTAYIYIRGEYDEPIARMEGALAEAYAASLLGKNILGSGFDLDIYVHRGAGAYICGEETALLESLEGKKGWPRLKPPFPAAVGLFGCPTVINNIETLSFIPHIINRGGEWFAGLGTERDGGTRLFSVSGHVKKPGVYELPMGYPLDKIIFEQAGGIVDDRPLKAVIPGGVSAPVLTPEEIKIPASFDSLAKAGSMLGSGAIIVMHDGTCMVQALQRITHFFSHESCGQCTPCREGTRWVDKVLDSIFRGEATLEDLDLLASITSNMIGQTICPLGDADAMQIQAFITKFRDDFERHIRDGRCPLDI
ncbi:MAG: NADH oxidoreductase (quinone) subunit F [Nitrospinota bacterium]|nr:MAG: NADH oxidoreductase (quinone) subunit F [Nitrospinota bacterium]